MPKEEIPDKTTILQDHQYFIEHLRLIKEIANNKSKRCQSLHEKVKYKKLAKNIEDIVLMTVKLKFEIEDAIS